MVGLEYKTGGLRINPRDLRFDGNNPYYAPHKFIVGVSGNALAIYVGLGERHRDVAEMFNIPGKRVGGGSFYLNCHGELMLNDYSGAYKGVPKIVAQKFAELLLPELEKLDVKVEGVVVNPDERHLNPFWIDKCEV